MRKFQHLSRWCLVWRVSWKLMSVWEVLSSEVALLSEMAACSGPLALRKGEEV